MTSGFVHLTHIQTRLPTLEARRHLSQDSVSKEGLRTISKFPEAPDRPCSTLLEFGLASVLQTPLSSLQGLLAS